jgi:hypothetical protein
MVGPADPPAQPIADEDTGPRPVDAAVAMRRPQLVQLIVEVQLEGAEQGELHGLRGT